MSDHEEQNLSELQDADLSRTVLRQIAIGATTAKWGLCPNCRKKVQVDVTDTAARVAAAKAIAGDDQTAILELDKDPAQYTPAERTLLAEHVTKLLEPNKRKAS